MSPSIGQLTLEELLRMSPEQKVQARKEGRLTSLGIGMDALQKASGIRYRPPGAS
jgi:hypothetical protein